MTKKATYTGNWAGGFGLKGFIGAGYRYSKNGTARFEFEIPEDGTWDVRISWQPHPNRSSKTKVQVEIDGDTASEKVVNQREAGLLKHGFTSLGRRALKRARKARSYC